MEYCLVCSNCLMDCKEDDGCEDYNKAVREDEEIEVSIDLAREE